MSQSDALAQAGKIEALLEQMRNSFLVEVPERCDRMEELALSLEREYSSDAFNELYRETHSLKGSGGTHGIPVMTTLCHQMENRLNQSEGHFDEEAVSAVLAYIDLLRKIPEIGAQKGADFSAIEEALGRLHEAELKSRKAVLVAESSRMMQSMYQKAMAAAPVKLTFVDDGLVALQLLMQQSYDYIVIAKELKGLNGVAVVSALRASMGKNAHSPVTMITSSGAGLPTYLQLDRVLARDQLLADNLLEAVSS